MNDELSGTPVDPMSFGAARHVDAPGVNDFLSSTRYVRRRAELNDALATTLIALRATTVAERRGGARALSRLSRGELGWGSLPLRDFFTDGRSREDLGQLIVNEPDASVVESLLSSVQFGYSRFIVHPLWDPLHEEGAPAGYRGWAGDVAGSVRDHPSRAVRGWSAYLSVLAGDPRGWEQYLQVLPHAATTVWLADAVERFGETMTPGQRAGLRDVLRTHPPRGAGRLSAHEAALAALTN
ncbi:MULTISPECIES: hypothetical protein [Microbacterium]|nr:MULTISPECIES: hypothetical protein [Microbacterium]